MTQTAKQMPEGTNFSALEADRPNEELLNILGLPNFACGQIANGLRRLGWQIAPKAELEQASVLFWMLQLYLKHGEKWRDVGEEILKAPAVQS